MRNITLPVPWFAFVVATRAALGVGVGLLLSEKLGAAPRRKAGWILVAIGAATTLPAALAIARRRKASLTIHPRSQMTQVNSEEGRLSM